MHPDQLLAQLRDIHSPSAPDWWPPAFGWWLLAILILTALGYLVFYLVRRYRQNAWRREAIAHYRQLRKRYLESPDQQQLSELVALLKRCARCIDPDNFTGSETGSQWQSYLNNPAGVLDQDTQYILNEGHYQSRCPGLDEQALDRIEKWIRRQKP